MLNAASIAKSFDLQTSIILLSSSWEYINFQTFMLLLTCFKLESLKVDLEELYKFLNLLQFQTFMIKARQFLNLGQL